MERMSANGLFFHRSCFRCSHCNCQLKIGGYSLSKGDGGERGKFFCTPHYRQLFLSNPEAINYSRAGASKRESRVEEVVQPAIREEEPVKRVPQQEPVKPVSPVEPAMRTSEDEVMRAITEDEEEIEVVKTPEKEVPDPLRPVKLVLPESSIEMEEEEEEEPWEVIEVSSTKVEVRVENGEWEEEARGSAMEVETQPPRVLSTLGVCVFVCDCYCDYVCTCVYMYVCVFVFLQFLLSVRGSQLWRGQRSDSCWKALRGEMQLPMGMSTSLPHPPSLLVPRPPHPLCLP